MSHNLEDNFTCSFNVKDMIDNHVGIVEELYIAEFIEFDEKTLDYYTKAVDLHYHSFIENLEE